MEKHGIVVTLLTAVLLATFCVTQAALYFVPAAANVAGKLCIL